jgi:hypothetical protein
MELLKDTIKNQKFGKQKTKSFSSGKDIITLDDMGYLKGQKLGTILAKLYLESMCFQY